MLATVRSATLAGVWGHPVAVEVHVADGLPGFTVVGLPDASCREARDRVRAAIVSTKLTWPSKRWIDPWTLGMPRAQHVSLTR